MDQRINIQRTIWIIVVTLFVLLAAVPVYADCHKQGEKALTRVEISKQKEVSESTAREALLFRASDLIGSVVKTSASARMSPEEASCTAAEKAPGIAGQGESKSGDEKIGTVGELVICDNVDKIAYVILTSQDKYYPVPWRAFDVRRSGLPAGTRTESDDLKSPGARWDPSLGMPEVSAPHRGRGPTARPALFLKIDKESLRQAPTIDSTLPIEKLSDLKLYQEVDTFYCGHVGREAARAAMVHEGPAKLLKVSKIKGLKLQDSRNADLGKIQDLLVDAREGHVAYGLVSFGGFMGIRDKTAAVPWSALSIRTEQGYAALDGSRERLEAAVIDEGNVEKLAQPEFARRIHDTFGASPYWEVFGFVPGEETAMPANPWHPDSAYSRTFDPSTLTTIEGTIRSVDTVYPEGGAAPGTRLDVEIKEGETVAVCAGPRAFAAQNGIEFGLESKISVTGSKTKVNGESVIMASEIWVEGKTLRLRDAQGRPEWKIEDLPPED